jgi:hypothetical protein
MVVSAAKLEANRRNSLKSTGPRTEQGKENSKMNATKHGLRAETLVMRDEDPQVLEDRREAWRSCLLPDDDVEQRLVDDAVVHTWLQDRARRAQAGRINANIANFGVDQRQTNAIEVDDLGRRLFKDRCGPLMLYPSPTLTDRHDFSRDPSTSFPAKGQDDPDRPSAIILCLQSTLQGCEWLLAEWAKLKAFLDRGQPWISSDKLKAVRLLGKQPFDAIDDRDVAMVFLASYVLKPDHGAWYWEIARELADNDVKRFRKSAAARELDSLKPQDAAMAREALRELIGRATERLTKTAEAHQERARAIAAAAPDFLAFDDSPYGERLRRFDLANGRGLARSLSELRRHRRSDVSGPLSVVSGPQASVVSGPLSAVGDMALSRDEPIAPNDPTDTLVNVTNEPTAASENVTNEANNSPLSVVSGPLLFVADVALSRDEPNVTDDPTETCENVTNEATVAQISTPNEPTEACENVTNEPKLGDESERSQRTDHGQLTTEHGQLTTDSEQRTTDNPEEVESFEQGVARRKAAREEVTRKLNEEARKEAEAAIAMRRARVREQKQKQKNAKPRNQPKGRETRTGQGSKKETAAREMKELNDLVAMMLGPYKKARRAPS